jgi:oxygen-dependent protoporphyrinogen oxidase
MISVAVIGGGISGLSATYWLLRQGVKVTLFEASERAGGVIQSERAGEYLVEYGPSSIEGLDATTAQLMQNLDLSQERVDASPVAKRLYIVRRGRSLAVPTSALQFVRSPLFSPASKLRLLREPFIRAGKEQPEESAVAFAQRRLGREFAHYVVSPFLSGVLAGDPAQLSAQHALANLYRLEQRYGSLTRGFLVQARARRRQATVPTPARITLSFQEGLQTLTDALYAHLREHIRLNTPVIQLHRSSHTWVVTTGDGEHVEQHSFDAVIATTPLHSLPTICGERALDLSTLGTVEYPPLAILALGFRRAQVAHPLDGLGVLVPLAEHRPVLGTLFSSSLYPGRAPQGHVLLTTFIGGACQADLARRSPDELLALTLQELKTTLGISGQPVFIKHIYLDHSLPQYRLGYQRVLDHMARLEADLPGFFLAGNYRQGVSIRDALRSGYEATQRLISSLDLIAVN